MRAIGDESDIAPSVQLNNETLDFFMDPFEQDQGVHVANEESSHERVFCSSRFP